MASPSVTVTANKFDPNSQSFVPANTTAQTASPSIATFNQQMVNAKPPTQDTINSSTLKTVNPVLLTTPKVPDYQAKIDPTLADLTNQEASARAKLDAANAEAKREATSFANMQSLLGGKSTDKLNIYDQTGVTTAYNKIKDLSAQATGLQNEALAIPIQIQNEFAGTGATDAGVAPIQTSRLRDNALKALSLGQQAAIANADYDKAKNYADLKVDAKYEQMEADIAAKLTNISAIKEFDISPTEKKLAEVTTKRLKYEEAQVAEMKEKETAINELIVNAYKQDAPKELTAKAEAIYKGGGDIKQVAAALGSWANNYYQNEALRMELSKKKIEDLKTNGLGVAPVGSITKELGVTTDDYMKGIAGTESAGSKDAYGGSDPYKVLSGQQSIADFNAMSQKEKDNTAYGKYQVMGYNIPNWTQEAFGKAMTIQEFLNSPDKQEALMRFKAEQYYSEYGNWDDAASKYFSGHAATGNTRADKFGTSVPSYITKYRNNMGITSGADVANVLNLDKTQLSQYNDIINEVNSQTKNDMDIVKFANSIQGTGEQAKSGNRQAQVAVIFNFMKALDPTSTVRESEFSLIQNAQSLPQTFQQAVIKWGTGERLDPQMVDEMMAVATDRANSARANINLVIKDAETRAAQFKIPTGTITKIYKNRLDSKEESNKTPEDSLADDILNMQIKVESSTPKYIIF